MNDEIYKHNNNIGKYDSKTTYKDVYDIWIELYGKNVKESTLNKTIRYMEIHVLPVFGDMEISKIEPTDCQVFVNSIQDNTNGRLIYNYAKACMQYAFMVDMITSNPFEKVIFPKFKEKKKRKEYLEREQVIKLLDVIDDMQWKLMFRLLIFLGLRKGELLALHWSDVDIKNQSITINHGMVHGLDYEYKRDTPKNITPSDTLMLDTETVRMIAEYKKYANNIIMFPNTRGGYISPSKVTQKLNKYLKLAELPHIRVHDLRHTTASLLVSSGATIKQVQERMRHSDIKTTMNIYTHLTQDSESEMVDNFIRYVESR